jgi:hypothetical protein
LGLAQIIDGRIAFVIGGAFVVVWSFMRARFAAINHEVGLTAEEGSQVRTFLGQGNRKSAEEVIAVVQERHRREFGDASGIDTHDIIPEIGREISWADIVNHTFRILEFDRSDTTIDQNYQVQATSSLKPYGYLLVESPILNQKARLPIVHRDDFSLASSVFDEPRLVDLVVNEELLVTYAPKHLLPNGTSGSRWHVLHYVITPRGTLDSYYSLSDDVHFGKPDPQKLFGKFVYQGEIKVGTNSHPIL